MRRHRARAALLVAVSLLVVAAGCAAGEGDAATTTEAPSASVVPPLARPGAVASAGCAADNGDEMAALAAAGTISVDGAERSFILEVPDGAPDDQPLPLVVDMHGATGSASQQDGMTGFGEKGASNGFVVVSPQGERAVWRLDRDGPDIRFVEQLLDEIESTGCIDTSRVYLTGFSMGGMMSLALACHDPSRYAAIAPVAGMIRIDGCDDGPPVPLVTFHGTSDNAVRFDGTLADQVAFLVPYPSGPTRTELVDAWANRNGCSEPPTEQALPPDVELDTYACPADASVEMYTVDGGAHAWPGATPGLLASRLVGHVTQTVDATDVIWQFFEAHQRAEG